MTVIGLRRPTRRAVLRTVLLGAAGLTAAGTGGWWIAYRYAPPHANQRLSVQEAHARALAGSILLLDIRTPTEWSRTGLPEGAVPLDMRRDDFTDRLREFMAEAPDRPVALICAGGVRSARLNLRLNNAGFPNIIDVPEGMFGSAAGPGWLNSNLPVTNWQG